MCASLTVLFGVVAEFKLNRYESQCQYAEIETKSIYCRDDGYGDLSMERWHSVLRLGAHILVVVGTLLWGFGEMLPIGENSTCA